jgi:hypothetical protein
MAQDDDDWFVQTGADDEAPTMATPTPPPGAISSPPPVTIPSAPAVPWQDNPSAGGPAPDDAPTAIHPAGPDSGQRKKSIPGARRVKLPTEAGGPQPRRTTGEIPRQPAASGEAPFAAPGTAPAPSNLSLGEMLEATAPSGTPPAGRAQPAAPASTPPQAARPPSTPPQAPVPGAMPPQAAAPASTPPQAARPPSTPPQAPVPGSTPPQPAAQAPVVAGAGDDFNPFGESSFSAYDTKQDAPLSEAVAKPVGAAQTSPAPPVPSPSAMMGTSAGPPTAEAMTWVGVPSADSGVSLGMLGALFAIIVAAVRTASAVIPGFSTGKFTGVQSGMEAWLQAGAADAGRSYMSGGGAALFADTLAAQGYQPSPPLAWLQGGAQAVFGLTPWAPYVALAVPLAFALWLLFRGAAPQTVAVRGVIIVAIACLPVTRELLLTLGASGWAGVFLAAATLWLLGARGPRTRTACFGTGALAGLALATDPGHGYLILLGTVVAFAASLGVGRLRASRISGELPQHAALWLVGWAAVGLPVFIASRAWVSQAFKEGVSRVGGASVGGNFKALFGVVWDQGGAAFVALAVPLTLVAVATERRGGSVIALLRQAGVALVLIAVGVFAAATDAPGGPATRVFVTATLVTLAAGLVGGMGRVRQLLGERGPVAAGAIAAVLVAGVMFTGAPAQARSGNELRVLRGHQRLVDRAFGQVLRQLRVNKQLGNKPDLEVMVTPIKMQSGAWGSALPYLKTQATREGFTFRLTEPTEANVAEIVDRADLILAWAPKQFLQEGLGGVARAATDRSRGSNWIGEVFSEPHDNLGFQVVLFQRLSKPRPKTPPQEDPAAAPGQPTGDDAPKGAKAPEAEPAPAKAAPAKVAPATGKTRGGSKGNRRRRRR